MITGVPSELANQVCKACPDGQWPWARVSCELCPARNAGLDGICTLCPDGTEPSPMTDACISCPPGRAGRDGRCSECPDGFEQHSSRKDCTRCPLHQHEAEPSWRCTTCPNGKQPAGVGLAWTAHPLQACYGTTVRTAGERSIADCTLECEMEPLCACVTMMDGICILKTGPGGAVPWQNPNALRLPAWEMALPPAGRQIGCQNCPAGQAGVDGVCTACGPGLEPNRPRTFCLEKVDFRCAAIAREYADNETLALRLEMESIDAAARAWKILPLVAATGFVAFGIWAFNKFYQWWAQRRLLGFNPDGDGGCCRPRKRGKEKPKPALPPYIAPVLCHFELLPSSHMLRPATGYNGEEGRKQLYLDRVVKLNFKVPMEDTVAEIKRAIEKAANALLKNGTKVGTQPLVFAGNPLTDDEATAAEIGLEWDSQLQLLPLNVTAKLPRVKKAGTPAKTFSMTVAMSDPLRGIKEHIARETGVQWDEVTKPLMMGEQVLDDPARTVFNIGFTEGAVLEWEAEPETVKKVLAGPVSTFDIMDY